MARELIIVVSFERDGAKGEERVAVPFETGRHALPKRYPFDKNVYLGPDYGYSLGYIDINVEKGELTLGYAQTIKLEGEGKAKHHHVIRPGETLEYDFSLA